MSDFGISQTEHYTEMTYRQSSTAHRVVWKDDDLRDDSDGRFSGGRLAFFREQFHGHSALSCTDCTNGRTGESTVFASLDNADAHLALRFFRNL